MFILYINTEIAEFALTLSIFGMTVVFTGLVFLYLVFRFLPRIMSINFKSLLQKKQPEISNVVKSELSSEMNVAIAAAIYLYLNQLHDDESTSITIKRVSRNYSPWSSKIYGLNMLKK